LISDLLNQGNQLFSITINPIYNSFNFGSNEERGGFEYDLINNIVKYFPTITFIWFIYEKNEKGNLHIHAIISIKNFIDYNYVLRNNIIELLIKSIRVCGIICNFKNVYGFNNFSGYNHPTKEYEDG